MKKIIPTFVLTMTAVIALGQQPNQRSVNTPGSTVGRQTQGATFGEKVNQGLHATGSAVQQGASMVAGNPIGGIIVKGGKNPGGSTVTTTTNNKGEFEFTASEDGDYLFTITAQGDGAMQRDTKGNPLYEVGGQSSSNPMFRTMTITSNNDGTFQLNGIKAGNYRFVITARK